MRRDARIESLVVLTHAPFLSTRLTRDFDDILPITGILNNIDIGPGYTNPALPRIAGPIIASAHGKLPRGFKSTESHAIIVVEQSFSAPC